MRNLFKHLIWFSILVSGVSMAAGDPIYVPNLPGYVTGTSLGGGHIGLDINGSITPSGTQDVNLIEVGGASIALGQTTMSGSIPVVLPSDQSPIPVAPSAGTSGSAVQSTTVGNGAAVSFSAPANAISVTIEASSSNTQNLRCAIGTTATTTLGLRLEPGRSFDNMPVAATVTCIAEAGSNQEVDLQWVIQ